MRVMEKEKFDTLEPMISQSDMAKLLGITTRTLRIWDKDKLFVARRTPSNRPFYLEKDYDQFLEDSKTRAEA